MGLRCGPNDPWVHSQCLVPYVLLIFLWWVSWPCENYGHSIFESLEQQPGSYSISEMKGESFLHTTALLAWLSNDETDILHGGAAELTH